MVHHYTEFMDISNFDNANEVLSSVISCYDALEEGRIPVWRSPVTEDEKTHSKRIQSSRRNGHTIYKESVPYLGESIFTFDQYCIDKLFPAF